MKEKIFEAKKENLSSVMEFIDTELEKYEFSMKLITQFNVVIEEIFVNISNYAYKDGNGICKIKLDYDGKNKITIIFEDNGIKFNPLDQEDPDITLSAEEREIGGLGIFMVKKMMDNLEYKYEDNKNILTLIKNV